MIVGAMNHRVAYVAVAVLVIVVLAMIAEDIRAHDAGRRFQGWGNLIPVVLVVAVVWAVFGGR